MRPSTNSTVLTTEVEPTDAWYRGAQIYNQEATPKFYTNGYISFNFNYLVASL